MWTMTKKQFISVIETYCMRMEGVSSRSEQTHEKAVHIYESILPRTDRKLDRFNLYGYTVLLDDYTEPQKILNPHEYLNLSFLVPEHGLRVLFEQIVLKAGFDIVAARGMAIQVISSCKRMRWQES